MKTVPVGLLIPLMLLVACKGGNEADPGKAEEKALPVEAVEVSYQSITREVRASGTAKGIREAYVVSQTNGIIQKVSFDLGQRVKQGQLLLSTEDNIQEAAYHQARAGAKTARTNLQVTKGLHAEGNASDAELDMAVSQASGAQSGLAAAEKAFKDCHLRAPITGEIAHKDPGLEIGNLLAPGTMVARMVDISRLRSTIAVGQSEVGFLRKGLRAEIRVPAAGNVSFTGRVKAVAAGNDPATGSYPVEVTWRNTKDRRVKSGMSVFVSIQSTAPDSALMVPAQAVVERDRKDAAFVAQDGKAALRFVETGRHSGNLVEIINGLSAKEVLIVSGMTKLSRGDAVSPMLLDPTGPNR